MSAQALQNRPRYEGMKVTREEYLDLEDDGFQYDMINGVLKMSPSPLFDHSNVFSELLTQFRMYFHTHKTGSALGEIDVYMPDGGDVLRPDISVILKENFGIIKGHIHGVPDMVVEVLSSSTKERDLGIKAERYLANGVREYWIADPDEKTLAVWVNVDKKSWRKRQNDVLRSEILTGLELRAVDTFRDLES